MPSLNVPFASAFTDTAQAWGSLIGGVGSILAVAVATSLLLHEMRTRRRTEEDLAAAREELQTDRRLRFHPIVVFDKGAVGVPVKLRRFGRRLGGINPKAVEEAFPAHTANLEVIDNTRNYGSIRNIGAGPALDVHVWWVAEKLHFGGDVFTVDAAKQKERKFGRGFNNLPAVPSILGTDDSAQMTRIPTFLIADFEQKITKIEGVLRITYSDIFGNLLETRQLVRMFVERQGSKLELLVTFADLLVLPSPGQGEVVPNPRRAKKALPTASLPHRQNSAPASD
ncbi:hypothetical protein [Micromonospora zamorensis]|uniref:hypothetical protein n=1 Tax=Micromonospora zamorensis TaxID=709883 RepID=UPI0033BB1F0A